MTMRALVVPGLLCVGMATAGAGALEGQSLKHYGTAERRAQATAARLTIAKTVSAFYTTTNAYSR